MGYMRNQTQHSDPDAGQPAFLSPVNKKREREKKRRKKNKKTWKHQLTVGKHSVWIWLCGFTQDAAGWDIKQQRRKTFDNYRFSSF